MLMNEWMDELWYIHTVDYYSAIKLNGTLLHAETWRKFENIKWKRSVTIDHILYGSIYMKYLHPTKPDPNRKTMKK